MTNTINAINLTYLYVGKMRRTDKNESGNL